MSNRTLVLLKPDAVERGLVGAILSRFEQKGLRIAAMELRTLDAGTLALPPRAQRPDRGS